MAKVPQNKVIIVGGGLAGLLATMKVCEGGGTVGASAHSRSAISRSARSGLTA